MVATPPAPSTASRLAALLATSVLTGTAGGVLQLGVPLLALSMGAANQEIALVRSVSGVGMLLLVVPVGIIVDRFGARRVFRAGAAAGAAVAALYTLGPSLGLVVGLMAVEGFCAPLRFTSLTTSFYGQLSAFGVERAGWFKGAMSFGLTFLGPLAGGLLARDGAFPTLFAVVAGLHLSAAALGLLFDLDGGRRPIAAGPGLAAQGRELLGLLRTPGIRAVLAAELLGAANFASFSAFLVVIVLRVHHGDAAVASRILIVEGVAFIVTAFLGGRLARRRRTLQLAAGLAGVGGALGTAVAPGPAALGVAAIGIGLASGLLHVLVSSWIGALARPSGKVSSIFQVAAGLGVTLGPLVTAAASRRLPPQAVLLVFTPLFLLLAWSAVSRPTPSPAAAPGGPAPAVPSPTT